MTKPSQHRRYEHAEATAHDVINWVLHTGRHLPTLSEFVRAFGDRLVAEKMPIWRMYFGLRWLHPAFRGQAIIWERATRSVVTKPRPHGIEHSVYYRNNPVSAIFERGERIRRRLDGPGEMLDYPLLHTLRRDGGTDYFAVPLEFHDHQYQAVAFTTDRPKGFEPSHIATLDAVLPSVAAVVEIFMGKDATQRLLATYVGERAGTRVLSGAIRRGQCETIRAVLWLCDMENFTEISETLSMSDLVPLLDAYLDAVVAPIERNGGEVLKFVGDAVLAIFELPQNADDAAICGKASAAAREAIAAVEALNGSQRAALECTIGCGVALHIGEVSYGNVGAADRLDFTVIGPAVNLVARLEQLTRHFNTRIVLSHSFVKSFTEPTIPLGSFALKGIRVEQRVFGLPDLPSPRIQSTS